MNAKLMSHQSFLVDFMLWLRSLRFWLLANAFGVLSISIVYAFFIAEPKYKSTATFLPPVGAENSFAFLKGLEGFSMSGGQDISPEQIEIIFAGETFGRDIIDRFSLIKRFENEKRINPYEKTLKILRRNMSLKSEAIATMGFSSITAFSLVVEDRNIDTAFMMADYAFRKLDGIVQDISADRARQKRIYMEEQLKNRVERFYLLQDSLIAFQKKHKLVDAPEQARLAMSAAAQIESEIMINDVLLQTDISTKGAQSSDANSRRTLISGLKNKLNDLENRQNAAIVPGLMVSLDLAPKYYRLTREIDALSKVLVFLGQQVESERLSEAKSINRLKLVDRPWKAEYKHKPKRIALVLGVVVFEILFVFGCLLAYFYWKFVLLCHPTWLAISQKVKN